VYYARDAEILQEKCTRLASVVSAFVTGGALFGIKLIRSNAKHVVALDADAMKNGARDRRKLGRALGSGRSGMGASGFSSHGTMVARAGWRSKNTRNARTTAASQPWAGGIFLPRGCGMGLRMETTTLRRNRGSEFPIDLLSPSVFRLGMKHGESRARLARIEYLGTFQARCRPGTAKPAGTALGNGILTPAERQGREHAK
jgi:hypothetical protein